MKRKLTCILDEIEQVTKRAHLLISSPISLPELDEIEEEIIIDEPIISLDRLESILSIIDSSSF